MNKMKSESKLREWYTITAIINYSPKIARRDAFKSMEVLMGEKHLTLNENYTVTHSKTGMNIDLQEFLRGVFVMKTAFKDHQEFF